ncbi:PqqD family protein [Gymnodinialimonas sp.]
MSTPAHKISVETVVARKGDIVVAPLGDEIVTMSMATDSYNVINPVGTDIWRLLEEPMSVAAICAALQEDYEIDDETCLEDTCAFVERLIEESMIIVV